VSVLAELSARVGQIFDAVGIAATFGTVVPSQHPDLAQFQCNGALGAAKGAGRPPHQIASDVVERLEGVEWLRQAEVSGPGFINLTVTDDFLAVHLSDMAASPRLGVPGHDPQTVVVDYGGPNVAKAMHVGHLRATIIGESLQRIMRFLGHRVIRDPHFGDWGTQMGMLIVELERRSPELVYFDADFEGPYPEESPVTLNDLQEMYPAISARCETDPVWAERARRATVELQQGRPGYRALWWHMKQVSQKSQRRDFADLGVEFDLWYGESDVHDRISAMVDRLVAAGVTEVSDGALIVRVDQPDDKREWPPFILAKSDGGFLYSTTDLATLEFRVDELSAQTILYVVDARQADHFELVFRVARKGGLAGPEVRLEHIHFGTMNAKDRRPFKTREGGVVRLRDLIEMVTGAALLKLEEASLAQTYPADEKREIARRVGVAALKFGDLVNNRQSDYIFDLDRFASFDGKTGPYIQYASARIGSVLRKAAERQLSAGSLLGAANEWERKLVLQLVILPEVVLRSAELRAPNHLAEYAYELAAAFNRFYDSCHVLSERDANQQGSWLALFELSRRSLVQLLDLLGIEVPERM